LGLSWRSRLGTACLVMVWRGKSWLAWQGVGVRDGYGKSRRSRLGKTRQGKDRPGKARRSGRDKALHGESGRDEEDWARQGLTRKGRTWHGKAGLTRYADVL
jgi:hypothetical protein